MQSTHGAVLGWWMIDAGADLTSMTPDNTFDDASWMTLNYGATFEDAR